MNCVHSDFHGDGENWECPVKVGPISESIFTLVPFSKKLYKISERKLFTFGLQSLVISNIS